MMYNITLMLTKKGVKEIMVFSNLIFLFGFLPIVLAFYFVGKTINNQWLPNIILLIASLIFYAWGEPVYIWLMITSIVINYFFGIWLDKEKSQKANKLILAFAIIINLSLLGYFKYANFFADVVYSVTGFDFNLEPIALPIGISFYTFHAISYLFDIYLKKVKAQKHFLDLALYISVFPQLVAGPIVRYNTINHQLRNRIITNEKFAAGVKRFILGLSKKVLVSNQLAIVADEIFATPANELSLSTAWIGILAYTLQIYFDFSGYSDMAIGLGKMFGFDFPENFNYPYISRNISEFWRRWHMSLSSWFRDYVYIPLGGSRVVKWKVYRNILIVWTLTGFWHGASWTFMAWGFYYGIIISLEKALLGKVIDRLWRPFQHVYTIFLFMIGWVFFRADNFTYSFNFIGAMFGKTQNFFDSTALYYLHEFWFFFLIGLLFCTPILPYIRTKWEKFVEKQGYNFKVFFGELSSFVVLFVLLIWSTLELISSTYNPFIYFRF